MLEIWQKTVGELLAEGKLVETELGLLSAEQREALKKEILEQRERERAYRKLWYQKNKERIKERYRKKKAIEKELGIAPSPRGRPPTLTPEQRRERWNTYQREYARKKRQEKRNAL